jgi:Domain of unknown function (DUF4347)/Bacterial Ig domain
MSANFDLPFELSNLDPLQNTFPTTTFSVVPITRNLEGKNIAAPIQLDPLGHDQYLPVPDIYSIDAFKNSSLISAISADNQQSTIHSTSDQITGFSSGAPFLSSDALANISKKELVFIDSNVTDYQSLLVGIKPSAEVILLKGDRDGITQITDALKGRSGITSIQILSHGKQGEIQLGNSSLTQSNLANYANQLQSWSSALTNDADILLFGCDIASGETGNNFIHQIATLTGADVAASTNLTGNNALGGDWVLEDMTGAIEADFAISAESQAAYSSVLLTPVTQLNSSSGLVLSSFVAGATTFNAAGILDAVVLRRVDNSVTNDGSTSDASVLQRNIVWIQDPALPAPGLTEELALLGNDLSFGTDNLFKNDSTSPEQNTNNIERVDVISNGGIVAPSSGLSNIGFLIVDRGSGGGGANDPFQIAGITSDPNMTAATAFTYGTTPIAVTMADYGVTGTSLNYNIFNDMDGMGVYVDNTGNGGMPLTQALNAVFVSFEELGIMPGQTFYGFSLAGTDAGTNLSDFTTFPINTNDVTGGLDLAATGGVFFIGNLPPMAVNDSITTSGTPATIGVLTNDTDPNGDPLTITGTTDGMNGMVTTDPGPTSSPTDDVVIYTPNAGFTGTDSFTYTISDGMGGLDTATVTVTVGGTPPDAIDDTAATTSGTPATIGVLTNDTDPNGDPLTITGTTDGMNGMVTTDPGPTSSPTDDVVIYTPNSGFTGTDSFTYTISDGMGGLDTATVVVTVNNDIPDAVNDSTTTASGTPVSISVLTNDTDPNGDPLTITTAAPGMNGTTSINTNGTPSPTDDVVVYTPNTGFSGTDSFTYTISDGMGGLDTATVVVTVDNNIPDAVNDSTTTASGTPVSISVLTNDTDPNGDPLTITTAAPGMNGTTSLNTNGTPSPTDDVVVYTPNSGFTGTDSFTYTISDGMGGLDTATVTVSVGGNPPDAIDDTAATTSGTPATIGVLTNDTDPNGDPLTITGTTDGMNGMVTTDPGPTASPTDDVVIYTPNAGFTGTDSFTYTISDGMGGLDTATVTVTVGAGANQPPSAIDDMASTMINTPVSIAVLSNDMDPNPGDTITISGLGTPGNGAIAIEPGPATSPTDDVIVYTPNNGFMGADTFTYTITDGMGGFDTAPVTVAVGASIGGGGGIDPTPTPTPTPRPSEFPPLPSGGGGGGGGGGDDSPAPPQQQDFVGLDTLDVLNVDQTVQDRPSSGRNTIEDFFDANYYLTNNPAVAAAIGRGEYSSALDHFERVGKVEGRNPSIYYDEKVYLDYNPGVAAAVARGEFATAFDHFIQDGQFEKRDPRLLLFDAQWYLFKNPDAKAAVANGLVKDAFTHYLDIGQFENRSPSILFDPNLYLQLNPSAAEAVRSGQFANAFQHYISVGLHEGLTASVVFNNKDYLALYPDVSEAIARGQFQSGTEHFLRFGQYQNRQPQLMIFNEGYYLENNPDVKAAVEAGTYKDGLEHFILIGEFENRDPGPLFDTGYYLATYPDVAPAIASGQVRSAYDHYRRIGRAEGRLHVPPESVIGQGLFASTFVDDALSSTRDEFNTDPGRFAS